MSSAQKRLQEARSRLQDHLRSNYGTVRAIEELIRAVMEENHLSDEEHGQILEDIAGSPGV